VFYLLCPITLGTVLKLRNTNYFLKCKANGNYSHNLYLPHSCKCIAQIIKPATKIF